jgi:hypothetical protein
MCHGTRLVGLIVPEGRIGRKGKSGPLFFSFFPELDELASPFGLAISFSFITGKLIK